MTETDPEKRPIGYARVSTYGQTLDSQLEQLRAVGCRNIYREKVTGARADRRELNRMLGKLAPGELVTVTRIDRLARSTFDLFAIVKQIVDAKAQVRSSPSGGAGAGAGAGNLSPFPNTPRTPNPAFGDRDRSARLGPSRRRRGSRRCGTPPAAARRRCNPALLDERRLRPCAAEAPVRHQGLGSVSRRAKRFPSRFSR